MKTKHHEEMTKLKRQLVARVPFDELQRRKHIGRLQSELNAARQELGKNQAQKEKSQKAPQGVDLIDNTLQIIQQMQQQKNLLKTENEQLMERVGQLEKCITEGTDEKKKYMEGAVWMGKKMSTEVERVCQSFEFLLVEYKQRL